MKFDESPKYEGLINKGDIFSYWCHRPPFEHDLLEYWLHAEIVRMDIIDIPIRDDDFIVQAEIEVFLRVKINSSGEIIEKSFKGRIGYSEQKESYFFVCRPPYRRKTRGIFMSEVFSNQTFGRTVSLANSIIKREAEQVVRHIIKDIIKSLSTTQQPI